MLADPVHDEVVNDPAALVQHHVVLRISRRDLGQIVGEGSLEDTEPAASLDEDLAQVGQIEQPHSLANGAMLRQRACVFERHPPAGECGHASAKRSVLGLEWCVLQASVRPAHSASARGGTMANGLHGSRAICRSRCLLACRDRTLTERTRGCRREPTT